MISLSLKVLNYTFLFPFYSIILQGKDIKLWRQDCFCIFFMAETTDTTALEKFMCVNNP